MKKLLMAGIAIVLLGALALTALFSGLFSGPALPDTGEHFTPAPETHSLEVVVSEGGSVNITEGEYEDGAVVELVATPEEGYVFAGWLTAQHAYLTISDSYSVNMTEDTVLHARFAVAPEDMLSYYDYMEFLDNCDSAFSFKVNCDIEDEEQAREYLLSNLKVVDAYYLGSEKEEENTCAITVEKTADGAWLVKPAEGHSYAAGATYNVALPESTEETPTVSFADIGGENTTLDFTVAAEEQETVEQEEGIVFFTEGEVLSRVDDGLNFGEEGDVEDYVVLPELRGLDVGDIFCVYSGDTDENGLPVLTESCYYGKVVRIDEENTVVYDTPAIAEIYRELQIVETETVDFTGVGLSLNPTLAANVEKALLSDATFQDFIAVAQQATVSRMGEQGYTVETLSKNNFSDLIRVEVTPELREDKVIIDLVATLELPVKQSGKQVAHVSFRYTSKQEITLHFAESINAGSGKDLRLMFKIDTATHETASVDIFVKYDGEKVANTVDRDVIRDECLRAFSAGKLNNYCDASGIRRVFKNSGYGEQSEHYFDLVSFSSEKSSYRIRHDVQLALNLNMAGSLSCKLVSDRKGAVTITNNDRNEKVVRFAGSNDTKIEDAMFAGEVEMYSGIRVDSDYYIKGLSKNNKFEFIADIGCLLRAAGIGNSQTGHAAGTVTTYLQFDGSLEYVLQGNRGKAHGAHKGESSSFGSNYTLLGYKNQEELLAGKGKISVVDKETAIFDMNVLSVNLLLGKNNGTLTTARLDPASALYDITVTLKNGEYLRYEDGKLIVADNAPLYFDDEITVTVTAKNGKDGKRGNGWGRIDRESERAVSYLPTVTLKVEYGNEDAYYESLDTDMQKYFRKLYRSYNAADEALLKQAFDDMVNGSVTIPENYRAIFDTVIVEYIDELFAAIKSYRAVEDGNRTMENRLVAEEAEAFSQAIRYMNVLMQEKRLDAVDTDTVLALVTASNALHNTLVSAVEKDSIDVLTEKFAALDEELKSQVLGELNDYAAENADNEKAQQTVNSFKRILGFVD